MQYSSLPTEQRISIFELHSYSSLQMVRIEKSPHFYGLVNKIVTMLRNTSFDKQFGKRDSAVNHYFLTFLFLPNRRQKSSFEPHLCSANPLNLEQTRCVCETRMPPPPPPPQQRFFQRL